MPDSEALVESRSCKLNKKLQIVAIKLGNYMYFANCAFTIVVGPEPPDLWQRAVSPVQV